MEKDILYSLNIANKLKEDQAAAASAQPTQQQAPAQTQQAGQTTPPIDEKTLEQAFEGALKNTKDEILKSFQETLEKFGQQLVDNLKKELGNDKKGNMEVSTDSLNKMSGSGGNNQQQTQNNNTNNGGTN